MIDFSYFSRLLGFSSKDQQKFSPSYRSTWYDPAVLAHAQSALTGDAQTMQAHNIGMDENTVLKV